MVKLVVIGIIITVVSIATFISLDKKNSSNSIINGQPTSLVVGESESKVNISGEVNHPGDYVIATDKTLGDLIYLAGGVTAKADSKAYNSSILISPRTEFYIAPSSENSSSCAVVDISKVNINTADEQSLISIGFNASQAANIVSYRSSNGQFEAIEDILEVKGIGKSTYAKVRTKITIS